MKRVVSNTMALSLLTLTGCASAPTQNIDNAVDRATKAAEVAHESEQQVNAAQLLGLVQGDKQDRLDGALPSSVCKQNHQAEAMADDLGAYADAINAVSKVATKPDDTSYSGYAAQFRKNQALIAQPEPNLAAEQHKQEQMSAKAETLCGQLMMSDLTDGKLVAPTGQGGALAALGVVAVVASIDQLVKAGLGVLEGMQRQVAVRHVMDNAIVTMRASYEQMSQPIDPEKEREPYLRYSNQMSEAAKRNATTLGMVLSIQRWMLAQRLRAEWRQLTSCAGDSCATDWGKWQLVDNFLSDRDKYISVAAIDPNAILKVLGQSIDDAAHNQDSTSITNILDSLSSIANSVSDVDDKYQAYRKTRN